MSRYVLKSLFWLCCLFAANGMATEKIDSIEQLGHALFFDPNLSHNRTQSCSSCHSPDFGFVDPRTKDRRMAFSLGADGHSLGQRNAPTISYAAFSPEFTLTKEGDYLGGQFYDGREKDLANQAKVPILDKTEMAMPTKRLVIERLQENSQYKTAFKQFYGKDIFANTESAFDALADSIAAFEKTDFFAPFDSKYDRYLRNEYIMSEQEELGMTLFFSKQFTNCNLCHQLKPAPQQRGETFSNYEYHNIGVPRNINANAEDSTNNENIDRGLFDNPFVHDSEQAGKFKVPTLRNVAVTAPYMHNGVFDNLRTVVLFYNKYNSKSAKRQINPETNEQWRLPEVSDNLALEELETGPALEDKRIDALVAFMKTLTDKRYEHLLENDVQ